MVAPALGVERQIINWLAGRQNLTGEQAFTGVSEAAAVICAVFLATYGEELSTAAPNRSGGGRTFLAEEKPKMTTDQKAASAVGASARRDIARGFQLVLGLALYLLGPVGIFFGIPLIVTALAPSKVRKAVAIVYFILVLVVAALMAWSATGAAGTS